MRNKFRSLTIASLALTLLICFSPMVLGLARSQYLTDFLLESRVENDIGFAQSPRSQELSYQATFYSMDILDNYNSLPSILDIDEMQNNLTSDLETLLDVNENSTLYNIYYVIKSLDIIDYSFDENLTESISAVVKDLTVATGGFTPLRDVSYPSIPSTYFAINILRTINVTLDDQETHVNWILSCRNSDGGFGGNSSLSSTLSTTYYSIVLLNDLNSINNLTDINSTLTYFESFSSIEGGFLPELNADDPLLSSTYYCTKGISLINQNELSNKGEDILQWVLSRQNVNDGGFGDYSESQGDLQSSVLTTYFAYITIELLDSDLSSLSEQIGMVEFNWLVLLVVLTAIGVGVGIVYYIWDKRKI